MFQKVSLWGSICSIISVVALVVPQVSQSENQTTYGANSPNVRAEGDVNINYGASAEGSTYSYVDHPNGGVVLLISKPSLMKPEIVCQAEAGSRVRFLGEHEEGPLMVWVQVEVVSGTCAGRVGWVGKSNYRIHNG